MSDVDVSVAEQKLRNAFRVIVGALKVQGWWLCTVNQLEVGIRRCRMSVKLKHGQFKFRVRKFGETPMCGHLNMLNVIQAKMIAIVWRKIEDIMNMPRMVGAYGKESKERIQKVMVRVTKLVDDAAKRKEALEIEHEMNSMPKFEDLLKEFKET